MNSIYAQLLSSIDAERLVIICGAGLSIPGPSYAPSAAQLAQLCADNYLAATGEQLLPEQQRDLETLAEFFLSTPARKAEFRDRLIDWTRFNSQPNQGHLAVADLLLCRAVASAISTNFDIFIESAAEVLGERDFRTAVEDDEVMRPSSHNPLLKIHGCMRRTRDRILWCHAQIGNTPLADTLITRQMEIWRTWLQANLRGRDLVIVGFWSDWSYLNDVLSRAMDGVDAGQVYLVDPAGMVTLHDKAPGLCAIAEARGPICHVQESGSEFLAELRRRFGLIFVNNVLRESKPQYLALTGQPPREGPLIDGLDLLTNDELYDIRRDVCGVPPGTPVVHRRPQGYMTTVGVIHLLLRERDARISGSRYIDGDRIVRIVNGAGRFLGAVRAQFSASQPQVIGEEVVICDAQSDGGVPANILRGDAPNTVARAGGQAKWVTFSEARRLGYC